MSKTVFVGLSGGVDSAVSAALLKEQGYEVVGVFIKIWQPEFIECTWREDRLDAMRVCAALDIPFKEVDLSHEYKKEVVEATVRDYTQGITPNPDVLCNQHIKFGAFADWAFAEGVDKIATGHYARIEDKRLLRAKDTSKDQSYFLYRIEQKVLSRTLFPIGAMLKSEVRSKAQQIGLRNAAKPDSQGLCFVGEVSMSDFLKRYIPVVAGPVVEDGSIIGEHEGAALYTVGQRHGFSVEKAKSPGPCYVTRIDTASNTLHVSRSRADAARTSAVLDDMHWIRGEPEFPHKASVQARYHEQPVDAILTKKKKNGRFVASFSKPHIASPGQSLVMYDGDVCLGGGAIRYDGNV